MKKIGDNLQDGEKLSLALQLLYEVCRNHPNFHDGLRLAVVSKDSNNVAVFGMVCQVGEFSREMVSMVETGLSLQNGQLYYPFEKLN